MDLLDLILRQLIIVILSFLTILVMFQIFSCMLDKIFMYYVLERIGDFFAYLLATLFNLFPFFLLQHCCLAVGIYLP